MHEYSIVQSLLDMCEDQAKQNDAEKITKLVVKIGKLSGVEPHLLQTAFETFKEKTVCDGAEFVMNVQDVVVKCRSCDAESVITDNNFRCPKCESTDITIIDGEEMFLMSLEME